MKPKEQNETRNGASMYKILVIDDDEALRTMVCRTLTLAGFEVVEASDGTEGLKAARTQHPDLVVTDIVMPEKEGMEIIRTLRQELPQLPVIAMSGGNVRSGTYLNFALALGAEIVLDKPFRTTQLLDSINGLLARTR